MHPNRPTSFQIDPIRLKLVLPVLGLVFMNRFGLDGGSRNICLAIK